MLILSPAGSSPKVEDAIHMREYARRDCPSILISSPKQKKLPGRMHMGNQPPYAFDIVGRHQALFCKDILELSIILVGKIKTVCHVDNDTLILSFSNTTTASACHL